MELFLTKLKTLVKDCNYNDLEEMIRDAIVFDITNEVARERLLHEGADLTLDKAILIIQTFEYIQSIVAHEGRSRCYSK